MLDVAPDAVDGARRCVLGVDVALARWRDCGSALAFFDTRGLRRVTAPALRWPAGPLTPLALARAVDVLAVESRALAVALDATLGWRDPRTPPDAKGVGRRCEAEAGTQGKTGVPGVAYPRTQLGWTRFCIELGQHLLATGRGRFPTTARLPLPALSDGYWVLEAFPTRTWRDLGLSPLPAKARRPDVQAHAGSLAAALGLPLPAGLGHDDLQAVMAALSGCAAVGGPLRPVVRGAPPGRDGEGRPLEGYLYSAARPVTRSPSAPPRPAGR